MVSRVRGALREARSARHSDSSSGNSKLWSITMLRCSSIRACSIASVAPILSRVASGKSSSVPTSDQTEFPNPPSAVRSAARMSGP